MSYNHLVLSVDVAVLVFLVFLAKWRISIGSHVTSRAQCRLFVTTHNGVQSAYGTLMELLIGTILVFV
jgi:hypothetical protein